MKTLKSIDGKSLLIGCLLASTIFFAMGATGPADKWDDKQEWLVGSVEYDYRVTDESKRTGYTLTYFARTFDPKLAATPAERYTRYLTTHKWPAGWEPIGREGASRWLVRKRIK